MVGIAAMRAGTRASGVAAHRDSMARSSMQVMSECGGSGGAASVHAASEGGPAARGSRRQPRGNRNLNPCCTQCSRL